jgi:RHS repeat-associated protein
VGEVLLKNRRSYPFSARQTKVRIAADSSRQSERTLYLGSYEREIHTTQAATTAPAITKTIHRHSLGGFATYTRTDSPTAALPVTQLAVILKDHLGSTDCLLTSTWNGSNWNGSNWGSPTTQRESFDAWGERRDPATQVTFRTSEGDAFRSGPETYERGYTGHEQLDDSGLIHMNGRLYDPELGPMLSPDPYVQVPEYSKNFNRYSYVLNNPLNLTDPTGFSWLKTNWRTVVVIIVVAIVTWGVGAYFAAGAYAMGGSSFATLTMTTAGLTPALTATGMAATGAITGAVGGGLNAALAGGNSGDILRGATVGAVQGAIAGGALHRLVEAAAAAEGASGAGLTAAHVAGHGVVGGASNTARGGKFSDGFYSAAAGAAASYFGPFRNTGGPAGVMARTAQAGIVGGTVSVIGGGKFANGAYTAAFLHLLNAEMPSFGEVLSSIRPSDFAVRADARTLNDLTELTTGMANAGTFGAISGAANAIGGDFSINKDSNYYETGVVGSTAVNLGLGLAGVGKGVSSVATRFTGKLSDLKFRIGSDVGAIRWGKAWNEVVGAKNASSAKSVG